MYAEWGPDGLIPRDQRLSDLFPEISAAEREAWIGEFKRLDHFLWQIGEDGTLDRVGAGFAELMRQQFPFMDDAALRKASFLAQYYQWHG